MSKNYTFAATITITANSEEEARAYLGQLGDDLSLLDDTDSAGTEIAWSTTSSGVEEVVEYNGPSMTEEEWVKAQENLKG